ncbi:MAG: DUF3126 family protein [Alphaproteobacteria bacterium]|nr:DUF3126 family protein [Alphaproteobacteria bacterium]
MKDDAPRLQRYLQKLFSNDRLKLALNPKKDDMAEIVIDGEFIGTVYHEVEDGETSFQIQIAVLDIDLEDT